MMRISHRNRRRMVPVIDQMESRELLSTMVGPAPHAAVPPQSSAATGLHLVTSPTVTRSILTATTAIAANDIWSVGFANLAPNPQKLLAEHWNGSSWSVVPTPNPAGAAGGSQFHGVAAAASNDVWAVGQTYFLDANVGPIQTLIEHWNGTSWSVVPSPNPNGGSSNGNNVLSEIAAVSATDIWAVGYTTDPSTGLQQTLTEHWDGTSWSVTASPNAAPAGSSTLAGVTALGDGTVVAVGTISNNSNNNGLILQK